MRALASAFARCATTDWSLGRLAALALLAALAVQGSRFQVLGSEVPGSQVLGSLSARLHHVHYRVEDPSAAMAALVERVGGTREVVSGLGVGVRIGGIFYLFDRGDAASRSDERTRLASAYERAIAWLRGKGIAVDTDGAAALADAPPTPYHHLAFAAEGFEAAIARAGTPLEQRPDSALYDAGGVLVEIVRETELPDAFWCPMHPDVRSGRAGTCHLCGMALVPIPPPKVGEYRLDVAVHRTKAGASGLKLTVRTPDTNEVVRQFQTIHEKTFHLFVVSRDLEYFAHVHPEAQADGSFVLKHPLAPGEYMLIADFLPTGGTSQMVQRAIIVGVPGVRSRFSKPPAQTPAAGAVEVEGVRVALTTEDLAAGKDACLTFTLTDAKTGAPVTDLEPYLGAPAHMLMVRADLSDAVHGHPEELKTGGPTVSFHPLVPAGGAYRVWVQFQRSGRVFTAAFDVQAEGF
jgi:hypothetical protein